MRCLAIRETSLSILLDRQVRSAFIHFDEDFRAAGLNLQVACEQFFRRAGYQVQLVRPWDARNYSLLLFGDHMSVLDGSAFTLVAPHGIHVKRTTLLSSARLIGRTFMSENFQFSSRFSFNWMFNKCHGFKAKLLYSLMHRPYVTHDNQRAYRRMRGFMEEGGSVVFFPSGIIGDGDWKQGIGALILDYCEASHRFQSPVRLVPIYAYYNRTHFLQRSVHVHAPVLLDPLEVKEDLQSRLHEKPTSSQMAKHLQGLYNATRPVVLR